MDVQYNKALDIALGNSRKKKTWKNTPMNWSAMLDKFKEPTRTPETVAEYKAMSRERQSEIKDVGGFVGGYLKNGRRSETQYRSVLCLDADYADWDLWEDWKLIYGNAAAVYSTHKHSHERPRLRLVIPLGRNVAPDEYPALGRKIAATLDIDKFDDTTYDVGRLMYWPSASQDGDYFFDHVDGEFLDPDMVLSTYRDWRDVSSWPMSSRVAEVVKKNNTKQKDPLSKPGIVGAFCRAYTIQEAIEAYVPDYVPCDEPNRYTYIKGSTAAGVVIYDDKFSFSHHATDPASGQLCNAWDLVRLHNFADLDEDSDPDTAPGSRPSYKAMAQLANQDKRVVSQVVSDRMAEADEDFETLEEDDDAWINKLKLTEKHTVAQTIDNIAIILQNDPSLKGMLALDEMAHSVLLMRKPPWCRARCPRAWSDSDDSDLRRYLERKYGISGKDKIFDAVNSVAKEAAFHPVRDYLDSCEWDGVPRVETLLIDYLGAEDSEYTRAVTRKALAAAVGRIYRPGIKFDYMLTLRGRQGLGKSALIAKLGGKWFSDTFTTMQGKEAYEQVQGVWIVEIGELAGMKKAEAELIKLFISKTSDRFRPAYGRRIEDFPRQCVFVGTTNESQFLRDTTGNRRFWVVDTPNDPEKDMWDDLTPEKIKHIWGEAVSIFKAGEKLYLPKHLEEVAREIQETYEEENPKVGIVAEYLDRLLPEDWDSKDLFERRGWLETENEGTIQRTVVCTMEIWAEALGNSREKFDRYSSKEVRDIMAKLPVWRHQGNKTRTIKPYGQQRYYMRRGSH